LGSPYARWRIIRDLVAFKRDIDTPLMNGLQVMYRATTETYTAMMSGFHEWLP